MPMPHVRVRCNNCGRTWNGEEDVPLLICVYENGEEKTSVYRPSNPTPATGEYEIFSGCPKCKTDAYLDDYDAAL